MTTIIGLDRDGTINKDDNYYLGSSPSWRSQVEILPGVIEGIKLLNKISNLEIFIITNQPGVALTGKEFDSFDETRMNEVNEYILEILNKNNAKVNSYFSCPYISEEYALKQISNGRNINQRYLIKNCKDLKPNTGMLEKAAMSLNKKPKDCRFYTIGDRITDVLTGLNIGGLGILIPSTKTKENNDIEKLYKRPEYLKNAFLAPNFLKACKIIYSIEN